MDLNIDKIKKFINSLSEEDFYHYLSPTSYYNSPLEYCICNQSIPKIGDRRMLELYFFLKENKDDILDIVFEKLQEFQPDEEEFDTIGVNWYVLIFYLLSWDWKGLYNDLKSGETDKDSKKLIDMNEEFDRSEYFIINDKDSEKSYYTDNLLDCVYLAYDLDCQINIENLLKT